MLQNCKALTSLEEQQERNNLAVETQHAALTEMLESTVVQTMCLQCCFFICMHSQILNSHSLSSSLTVSLANLKITSESTAIIDDPTTIHDSDFDAGLDNIKI